MAEWREETAEDRALQEDGRKVLSVVYAALRALKLYPVENVTVQQALDELHEVVGRLLEREGRLELRVVGEFFFLNDTRLRLGLRNFSTFGSFADVLGEHRIGSVEIEHGVERDEWAPFLSLLLRNAPDDGAFQAFMERLEGTPVRHLSATPEREVRELEEEDLQAAKRTYAQSVQVAKNVLGDVRLGRAINVRKVKRSVQGIVDRVLANEPSMITMTTLRDFDEYTFTHCVNVCIFSVVIGQRLGLSKHQLYELGLGALFHDVGKMRIDADVINNPNPLTEEQWQEMQEHPTEGLLALFEFHGFAEVPYRQMLMAYEHHMKVDLTGYPENRRPRKPSLFPKIVAVADAFDAGTSIRSYQYRPASPDEVLAEMRDNPDRGFDPLLVKALINATGVYPIGTLVILDTLELAVVSGVKEDPEMLHLPRVKVISDEMGVPLAEPRELDLAETDPGTGHPARSIIKTTDPQKYGIRVSDYLVP